MRCFVAYVVLLVSLSGQVGLCASDESRPAGGVVTESPRDVKGDEIASLTRQVAVQQQQIAELQNKVAEILARLVGKNELAPPTTSALVVGPAPSPVAVPPPSEKISVAPSVFPADPKMLASAAGQRGSPAKKDEADLLSKVVNTAEKNPLGINLNPARCTAMTGHSSGRGICVTPTVYQRTTSAFSTERFARVHCGNPSSPLL